MNNLVFFGAPCSGKGTQSKMFTQEYSFVHLSVGDILRSEIELKSSIGKTANEFVIKGTMVPNKIIVEIISNRIDSFPINTKFIFDGIPRTMEQMVDFNLMVEQKKISDITFVHLNVSKGELLRRANVRAISEKRIDDQNISIIENRISNYEDLTVPVINSYSKTTTMNQVNGEQTIQKVFEDIRKIF